MRTLRQREVVAFPRSQLITGSTGDGGREGRLASQPEITWLWFRHGAREGLMSWSTTMVTFFYGLLVPTDSGLQKHFWLMEVVPIPHLF